MLKGVQDLKATVKKGKLIRLEFRLPHSREIFELRALGHIKNGRGEDEYISCTENVSSFYHRHKLWEGKRR